MSGFSEYYSLVWNEYTSGAIGPNDVLKKTQGRGGVSGLAEWVATNVLSRQGDPQADINHLEALVKASSVDPAEETKVKAIFERVTTFPLKQLPGEIFQKGVIGRLAPKDRSRLARVSGGMPDEVVAHTRSEQHTLAQNLVSTIVSFLKQKGEKYEGEVEKFRSTQIIDLVKAIAESQNLQDVKSRVSEFKKGLLPLLKDLTLDEKRELSKLLAQQRDKMPLHCQDLPDLLNLYDKLETYWPPAQDVTILAEIWKQFQDYELVLRLLSQLHPAIFFHEIGVLISQQKESVNCQKLVEIAETFADVGLHDSFLYIGLRNIAEIEIKSTHNSQPAVDAANLISNAANKNECLVKIAGLIAKYVNAQKAIELANTIQDIIHNACALRDIAKEMAYKEFAATGRVQEALQLARTIQVVDTRVGALIDIVTVFIEKGKPHDAIPIALEINSIEMKFDALRTIGRALLKSGEIDASIVLLNHLPIEYKVSGLLYYVEVLLDLKNRKAAEKVLERAEEVVNSMPAGEQKSTCLQRIRWFKHFHFPSQGLT